MRTLKDTLSSVIVARPDVLQFAKDRRYEQSWIIPLASSRPTETDINDYLKKDAFQTLIVEYIWNSQDDDNRFVLTLFLDEKCKLQDPNEFITLSLDLFYGYGDLSAFIKAIDTRIIGHEYMLSQQVDAANISVFNHWLSVGPAELWKRGDRYVADEIRSIIQARPEIMKTSLNYQGLLFRFNMDGLQDGPFYGIKTPCCTRVGKEWVVDLARVDHWMRLMLNA